jgi:hypothetical protein
LRIFEEAGNEVELARSYRAFATLLRDTMEYAHDETMRTEAAAYTKRAEAIFVKLNLGTV